MRKDDSGPCSMLYTRSRQIKGMHMLKIRSTLLSWRGANGSHQLKIGPRAIFTICTARFPGPARLLTAARLQIAQIASIASANYGRAGAALLGQKPKRLLCPWRVARSFDRDGCIQYNVLCAVSARV
jgi:hypothetical protein